jgi:hypothetical protein
MRVRLLKAVCLYWDYAVKQFHEGEEATGELARHLHLNTAEGTVEVLEHDPEPEQPVAPAQSSAPEQDPAAGTVPVDGSIGDLMAWVGDDPQRRAQALAAEQARDKPRATVLKQLAPAE